MSAVIGFLVCVFLGFVPMFFLAGIMYWLDRYEKEPKLLLGAVFAWGAVVAVIGALIFQVIVGQGVVILTGSAGFEELFSSSLSAPFSEELLKGAAVLLVFLFFRREFDSVLDGIVYASIAALGFAATEDVLYYFGSFLDGGIGPVLVLFFLRFVIFGWQHAFFTSFFGIGLAYARLSSNIAIKIFAPLLGLGLAMFVHSLHNTLLSVITGLGGLVAATFVAWMGWLFMAIFIVVQITSEKRNMANQLREEVALGVITAQQYHAATSWFGQSGARFASLGRGRYKTTDRFFQLCGELSLKKHQLHTLGDERGNAREVAQLRSELARLSTGV